MKNVYDNEIFFKEYQAMRENTINANNLIEIPQIKKMLPNLTNKTILDLGCGAGDMDKYFVEQGAKYVLATDISQNMINIANAVNSDSKIDYKVVKMEDLNTVQEKFDIVYSSLAFHYIEDLNKLLKDINEHLSDDGILIFSQESPLNTVTAKKSAQDKKRIEINGKEYFLLADYGQEGERNVYWNDTFVTKYHRTYVTLVNALIHNNFEIIEMQDSYATEEAIALCPKYVHQIDRPYFTYVKAKKRRSLHSKTHII